MVTRPTHPLCGPRLALHSQPAAAARRLRRVFPPLPSSPHGEASFWLASLGYYTARLPKYFTL
ncbi:MAG: hypothetical protein PHV80_07800, partial [Rugosibacter sp.]|nr:hypothetical protein [Rugosibacter sp.]